MVDPDSYLLTTFAWTCVQTDALMSVCRHVTNIAELIQSTKAVSDAQSCCSQDLHNRNCYGISGNQPDFESGWLAGQRPVCGALQPGLLSMPPRTWHRRGRYCWAGCLGNGLPTDLYIVEGGVYYTATRNGKFLILYKK